MSAAGAVIVFARAPEPGRCKTRLIPALGPEGAAALHRRLVRHTLDTALAAGAGSVELWCAPDTRHAFFEECRAALAVPLVAQPGGDLGQRMAGAFAAVLAGRPHALLLGSDAPSLTAADLRQAGDALAGGAEVVIVPAEDGGYVLIGLARPAAAIFQGIDWGSDRVLAQTLERLRGLGRRCVQLPARWDVDRPEDLARLRAARLPGLDGPAAGAAGRHTPGP